MIDYSKVLRIVKEKLEKEGLMKKNKIKQRRCLREEILATHTIKQLSELLGKFHFSYNGTIGADSIQNHIRRMIIFNKLHGGKEELYEITN
jgi:hypothetical protein